MTTNQTIDGAKVLSAALSLVRNNEASVKDAAILELRALLCANGDPAAWVQGFPKSCHFPAKLQEDKANGYTIPLYETPAAQPQGEPVGYVIPGDMPAQDGYTKTLHPVPEGKYTFPLYAEQPAPVAVVLPERPRADEEEYERMTDYEKGLLHGGIELWDKISNTLNTK